MTTYVLCHQPLSWFNNGWKCELLFFPHILQTKRQNLIDCYWLSFVSWLYILRQIKNEHIIDINVPKLIVSLITLNWNFVLTTQITSYRQLLILYVTSIIYYLTLDCPRSILSKFWLWGFLVLFLYLVWFFLWTLKPWSHIWILIYWMWAIKG